MRTSFELKILAPNLAAASSESQKHIASFIGCSTEEVLDKVDVELKVKTIDLSEDSKNPSWSDSTELYEVTVYASLKQGIFKPL